MNKSIYLSAFTAGLALPSIAAAEDCNAGLGMVICRLRDTGAQAVDLVFLVSMLIGVFIILSGIFTLKKAADSNGQQVTYGNALTKISIGALLMAPEVVVTAFTQTAVGGEEVDVTVGQKFKDNFKRFDGELN